MTTPLTYTQTVTFQAPIAQVFDALWARPGGDLLEVRHIVGTPRTVGHRQQLRCAFGGVDLLMIETVTAMTRPTHLQVTQAPDGFQRYDPAEREAPFLDSMVDDLDGAFSAQFGVEPPLSQIDFSLEGSGDQTTILIEISVLTERRYGWLQRRRWRKSVAKEAQDIIAGINARLQVQ